MIVALRGVAVVELYVCRMRCVTMFFVFTGGAELRIILPHAKSVFVSRAGLGLASRAPFFPRRRAPPVKSHVQD